jgi:prevent-host-death family protein
MPRKNFRPKASTSSNTRPRFRGPKRWQLQDAKAKFSQLVKESRTAPQIITLHGEEVAVIQSIERYREQTAKLEKREHWLDVLLRCPPGPELKFDRDPDDFVGAGKPSVFD